MTAPRRTAIGKDCPRARICLRLNLMSDDIDDTHPAGAELTAPPQQDRGAEILQLTAIAAPNSVRIVSEMRSYWQDLRRGRAVPDRADVEPQGIRAALDYAFILERIAPGAARFRLAGRHLVDLMGMEVRGMPICSFLNPDSRGRLSDVLETVFKGPQIAEIAMHSHPAYGRPPLDGTLLLLPLKSDLGDITRALGCLVTRGEVGRGPRRFDILSNSVFPVIEGAAPLFPSPGGFAEEPAPWRPPNPRRDPRDSAPPPAGITPEERRARFLVIRSEEGDR